MNKGKDPVVPYKAANRIRNRQLLKEENEMNEEKKIARAIIDAQVMRNGSYVPYSNENSLGGEYSKDIEECLISTCKKHGLSENLWCLLNLAMHWWNDIQLWAEDVLAGKNILEECKKENAKMKDGMKRVGDIADEHETDSDGNLLGLG